MSEQRKADLLMLAVALVISGSVGVLALFYAGVLHR